MYAIRSYYGAEALRDALLKLSGDEVGLKVVGSGVGGITCSRPRSVCARK